MQLNKILKGIEVLDINGSIDSEISDITLDSRKCSAGSLFIAAVGTKADGHDYIESAVKAGASAIIYQEGEYSGGDATYIKVPDSKKAAGLPHQFYGNPSSKFNLVGVTGTNGKTTTATLLYNLFTARLLLWTDFNHCQLHREKNLKQNIHSHVLPSTN